MAMYNTYNTPSNSNKIKNAVDPRISYGLSEHEKMMMMKSKFSAFLDYIQDIFSLDTRSLAVLRIGIGVIVLVDIIVRITYLTAFHTDVGILPSSIVMSDYSAENIRSIHLLASTY